MSRYAESDFLFLRPLLIPRLEISLLSLPISLTIASSFCYFFFLVFLASSLSSSSSSSVSTSECLPRRSFFSSWLASPVGPTDGRSRKLCGGDSFTPGSRAAFRGKVRGRLPRTTTRRTPRARRRSSRSCRRDSCRAPTARGFSLFSPSRVSFFFLCVPSSFTLMTNIYSAEAESTENVRFELSTSTRA